MRSTYLRRDSEAIAAVPQLVSFCDAIKNNYFFFADHVLGFRLPGRKKRETL
jgi:hypothetical protein